MGNGDNGNAKRLKGFSWGRWVERGLNDFTTGFLSDILKGVILLWVASHIF